ncbi:MAG: prepilin-type N-terminal cleavage/methylation domain-containing protein [Thermoanaerobaculia bacterium]
MRSQRGFSLAELLVALLVMAIVITTTLAMFVERQKRLRQATETILAYQALANEAEVRRRVLFKDLDASPATFVSDTAILQPLTPFATIVSVTTIKPEVKHVLMTVRWNNGQRVASLTLVRADTGGGNLW